MSLVLHLHPLSSFCHKVLFALYENQTEFESRTVDLQGQETREAYLSLWPMGKIPVLEDKKRSKILPETTIILEYLDQNYPGQLKLFPQDEAVCLEARLWDRIFDLYIHIPMQKIVADHMRSEKEKDPRGVEEAKRVMKQAYDLVEKRIHGREWILGDALSVADCAGLPALFYGELASPFSHSHPGLAELFERLYQRPSAQRLYSEAKPFFQYFPLAEKLPARFRS